MAKSVNSDRRRFLNRTLLGTTALGALGLAYSLNRGIRYPTLGLEPRPLATEFSVSQQSINIRSSDVIQVSQQNEFDIALRAFSAQPSLTIQSQQSQSIKLKVNNVSPDAELVSDLDNASLKESVNGINRTLTLTLRDAQQAQLRWNLPYEHNFTFASIGDSGGDKELAWCLQRAHDLGAKFLLHLGDFNYQAGDYERSIELFHDSPIPCFISIGNHDFHDSGVIYPQFLSELGPLNHAFTVGKTRFVNIDTAASMFPYSAGKRGKLLTALATANETVSDTVSFTHRPLADPIAGSTHDIGNAGERDWLISALKRINSSTLLSGHIHIYDRFNYQGIDNIIAGQGLGHQDILTNSDYSKMVIGEVATDGKVHYHTQTLSMPMELHCHPRSQSARDELLKPSASPEHRALYNHIQDECGRT